MKIDLFGIKLGTETISEYKKDETYEINKKQLLEKLGFKEETVTYIQWDYKTGKLKVRGKLKW